MIMSWYFRADEDEEDELKSHLGRASPVVLTNKEVDDEKNAKRCFYV